MSDSTQVSSRSVNQLVGYGFGAVYVVVGLLGFAVSGGHAFAESHSGRLLGVFMVNPLHNIAHLLVGALLVAGAAGGLRAAKGVNTLVGGVYLALAVFGLFVVNSYGGANFLAINGPDNGLHFASAFLLLAVGLFADRATARAHAQHAAA